MNKHIFRLLHVSILLIAGMVVYSQNRQLGKTTNIEGLSNSRNDFIYRDKLNFIWISSMKGINRFDTRRIKVFHPETSDTLSIFGQNIQSPFFEDSKGDIWFTTLECVNVYRRQSGIFDHYFVCENREVEYTALFLEQDRWLWVLANLKLFRFDTKRPPQYTSQFLHDLQAARFAVDTFDNGNVRRIIACYWAYKKGFEIIDYNRNSQVTHRLSYFTGENKIPMPPLTVRQALIENDTLVWLATDKGLVAFNPKQPLAFKILSTKPFGTYSRNLAMDNEKRLFVSTDKTPLLVLDKSSGLFTPLSISVKNQDETFIPMKNGAYELYIDKENVIWLSVVNEGVYYTTLKKSLFVNPFIQNDKPSQSTNQILEDSSGLVWALTTSNLNKFDKTKKKIGIYTLALTSRFGISQNNTLWSVSRTGVVQHFDDKKNNIQTVLKRTEQEFRNIIPFGGQFLIGSTHEIFRFDTKAHTLSPLGLNYFFNKTIVDRFNNLWCSTDGQKILYFQINADKALTKRHQINDKGVVNSFLNSPNDPSVIWAATTKGLLKINVKTLTDTLFTEQDGLPNVIFQAVLEDKKGNLWASTNRGIVRYNPITKTARQFTTHDGLSADEFNANAALLSSKGEMWFGSINGMDVFHPDSIQEVVSLPQAAVTGLKIYDKYWKGDKAIEVAKDISLRYFENTLTFELAALDYTDPEKNRYRVMLENYDRDWSDLGTQNFVTYVNLPAGTYIFKLKVANPNGIWNETPRVLQVHINPPFWRTWWFITLCLLAAMALVGYIVYLRLSKIIDLQEVRIKLYENLHDDLGSRLMAIVLMIDMALQKKGKYPPSVSEFENTYSTLSETKDIASNIVGNMRRLVWATDPENDELRNVVQQMKTDADILLPPSVDFHIQIAEPLLKLKVDGNKRYQMLSIVDEALNNIAKYAEATAVTITIEREGDNLRQTIRDNGKGFDTEKPREDKPNSGGRGLVNMSRRAKRIDGALTIESVLGNGTTIVLTFPLLSATFLQRLKRFFDTYSLK